MQHHSSVNWQLARTNSPDGSPIVVYRDVLSKLDNDMTHQQFTDSITSMMGQRGEGVCMIYRLNAIIHHTKSIQEAL